MRYSPARCSSQIRFKLANACNDFAVCPATYNLQLPFGSADLRAARSASSFPASSAFALAAVAFGRPAASGCWPSHRGPVPHLLISALLAR